MENLATTAATMDTDFAAGVFRGFGPSILSRTVRRPDQHFRIPNDLAQARALARKRIPMCPGVYGWVDRDGALIYVGKGKSLRHRLVNYFAAETADPKMSRIRRHSQVLVWEPVSHELLALIREQELITRWRPSFNVQGKPERQQPGFICISRGAAPSFFFARQVPRRAAEAIGPIAGRARLGEAIACLNYVFQLRDCPDRTRMDFSNQLQLFSNDRAAQCIRFELATCPGPCAGQCSKETYRHNVDKAMQFLTRGRKEILNRLEERMLRASKDQSFERACVLRDQLGQLKWLHRRIRQLKNARKKLDGIWRISGFDHQYMSMVIRKGKLIGCADAVNDSQIGELVDQALSLKNPVPRTHLDISWAMLLASWAQKYPDHLNSISPFD